MVDRLKQNSILIFKDLDLSLLLSKNEKMYKRVTREKEKHFCKKQISKSSSVDSIILDKG